MIYPEPHLLMLVGSDAKPGFTADWCDECGERVYIPPGGVVLLEEAKAYGREREVLCVGCGTKLYGQELVDSIHGRRQN